MEICVTDLFDYLIKIGLGDVMPLVEKLNVMSDETSITNEKKKKL